MSDAGAPVETDDRMPRWVPRALVLLVATMAGALVVWWLIRELRSLLVMILVALFISFAIEPAVNRLEKMGIRRGLGTGIVFVGLLVLIGFFAFAIGAALADQIDTFVDDAPGYITDVEKWVEDTFDVEVDTDEIILEFQEDGAATRLATRLAGDLVDLGTQVVNALFNLLTIGLFTFYFTADGPRIRRAICSLLRPDRQREVLRVWELAIEKTGGYIFSRGVLATISTLFHWAAFEIIDLPSPLPLALWMGVVSQFIPVIGTYIAGALPVLVGLLDQPRTGLIVLIVIVIYQQIENYLLAPPITAHTMELHVAVAFGAVLAGGMLLGVVGALLALPATATVQAFVSTSMERHEVVESELTTDRRERRRRRRRPPEDATPPT